MGGLPLELSEDGVASYLAAIYGYKLRFDHDQGRWFEWTGDRWKPDNTRLAYSYCREVSRKVSDKLSPRDKAPMRKVGSLPKRSRKPGTLSGQCTPSNGGCLKSFPSTEQLVQPLQNGIIFKDHEECKIAVLCRPRQMIHGVRMRCHRHYFDIAAWRMTQTSL
jgi:hypothetical protein